MSQADAVVKALYKMKFEKMNPNDVTYIIQELRCIAHDYANHLERSTTWELQFEVMMDIAIQLRPIHQHAIYRLEQLDRPGMIKHEIITDIPVGRSPQNSQ